MGVAFRSLPETIKIRPILDTVDELPAIPPDLLELCLWISKYYFYPPGEVFSLVIPFGVSEPMWSAPNGPRKKSVRRIEKENPAWAGAEGPPLCEGGQGDFLKPHLLVLTEAQSAALDETVPLIDNPRFQPFVLYGVTGSGKTEVYLRLIEKTVQFERGTCIGA